MTAQIDDAFRYQERVYALAGISEGELFDPTLLNLKPEARCTACWRGYQAVFALSGTRLILDALHVNLQIGPIINGLRPLAKRGEHDWFNNHYEGLDYHLEYTGGLLLADGFISELYVHMGFHPAWKYETVFELVFEGGVLRQEFDRSEEMAEARQEIAQRQAEKEPGRMPTPDEIARFVDRAFDRRYWA